MTNAASFSAMYDLPELWAVRGPGVLPVEALGDGAASDAREERGCLAATRDSARVTLRLVQDAVIVVRGAEIIAAGDYEAAVGAQRGLEKAGLGDPAVGGALRRARRWDGYILPGLVDLHCHGGGGASFPDAVTLEQVIEAVMEHLSHGTTRLIASLVTDSPDILLERTELLATACDREFLEGIHLEGPFLSPQRAGAQDPAKMQAPNAALVQAVAKTARGWFKTMTIAPELPGVAEPLDGPAPPLVEVLAAAGVVPSFGHTDASAEQMGRAVVAADAALVAAGAGFGRVATATHLFNGMRPIHHRDPGPALEAIAQAASGRMVVELIADAVHLAPRTARDVFAAVGPHHVALVTDAMAAAGMPDGTYQLGPAAVTVAGGVARLTDGGSIAGGTAHLIDVVRSAWRASGIPLADAVMAASLVPARVLGRADSFGSLAAGRAADLVLSDSGLRPLEVYAGGIRAISTVRE
ncbi:MAG: amidohydrolase family protein [Bifidobacteriaceae bacterium]|nr:amidohydrolase family protein [Bifidobacteriaceae bacterium]